MKNIAILGSTGSIGTNTLDVVSRLRRDFRVVGLAAHSNIKLLAEQVSRFNAKIVSAGDELLASKLRKTVSRRTKVVYGQDGMVEIASQSNVDLIVFATSGTDCLIPLLEAIRRKKAIALANKEVLVAAGDIIMPESKKNNTRIIPVDSEHSAIFQCLDGEEKFLSKIYLTGSGGPLLDVKRNRFDRLPRSFILSHPRWKMGKKISVDSATMMNKGLEIIEAKHLFGVGEDRIEVLVHREAMIHSMVEFVDGAILAQLAIPDMRIPIQYALTYPKRVPSRSGRIDFSKVKNLTFACPDLNKFPCLGLARQAAKDGGTAPAVLCASDEEAVRSYLDGRIAFSRIAWTIEKVLRRHKNTSVRPTIGNILEAEEWARAETRSICFQ